ncbi:MAG: PilZ domain-containing protein [Pseudomonadota bacterium]
MDGNALATNRRQTYRVALDDADYRALLVENQRELEPTRIRDINNGGASIEFNASTVTGLAPGQHVVLKLDIEHQGSAMEIDAKIIFVGANQNRRLVRVSFDGGANDTVPQAELFTLFNRRVERRPQPKATNDLPAIIFWDGEQAGEAPVAIRNVTDGGLGFAVDSATDSQLRNQRSIRVNLKPKDVERLAHAKVCYRAELANEILYGCEFDWAASGDARELVKELAAFRTLDK